MTMLRDLTPGDAAAVQALYEDAGWSFKPADPGYLKRVLGGGQPAVGIVADGRLVAMGRAISDGHMAFLVDVITHRDWRGRGLGRRVVARLETGLRDAGVVWIGMHAVPSCSAFYRKLGYHASANGVAMEKDL